MIQWYAMDDVSHDLIKFVILLAEYKGQLVIIKNPKRGGWEIPGGTREPGEQLLATARRELYEETGATQSEFEAFGILRWNGSFGMVFHAKILEMAKLPSYEIEEVKLVDRLPDGLNFGEMFYTVFDKWNEYRHRKKHENRLLEILTTHPTLQRDLQMVQSLELQNWCIAAGYVRNFVWDYLHDRATITPLNDIDVLYYDPADLSEDREKHFESQLLSQAGEYNWSVKNQARMHLKNNQAQYLSVEDAMKRWPETVTAVGVTLDPDNNLNIIAPHGLDDLFQMIVRRSPFFPDHEYYQARVTDKNWLKIWPRLTQVDG
jgi:hypothetical protein